MEFMAVVKSFKVGEKGVTLTLEECQLSPEQVAELHKLVGRGVPVTVPVLGKDE